MKKTTGEGGMLKGERRGERPWFKEGESMKTNEREGMCEAGETRERTEGGEGAEKR